MWPPIKNILLKSGLVAFLVGIWFIFCPTDHAHAEDTVIQVISDPAPSSDTSTVTSIVTQETIQAKIDSATATLQSSEQTQSIAIVAAVQANNPGMDTQTAVSTVLSIQPIKTAIDSATAKIESATVAINNANTGLLIVESVTATVESQTAIVTQSQTLVDSATTTKDNAQANVLTAMLALPALAEATNCTPGSACVDFYNKNAELGPIHDQIVAAQTTYDSAVQAAADAIIANQAAEDALNTHTPVVIAAQEANAVARDANDAAQSVLADATQAVAVQQAVVDTDAQIVADAQAAATASAAPGLNVTVYSDPQYAAKPPVGAGTIVRTTTVSNINYQWGSGSVMGGPSDRVQVKFEGSITSDITGNIQFYAPADDGTKLYVDNTVVINDWVDKGGGGSQSAPIAFTANVPKPITLWFYENGGGASVSLYWYKAGTSGYTLVPTSAFKRGSVDPILAAAVTSAQGTLQIDQATLDSLIAVQSTAQTNADAAYQTYMDANQAMAAAEADQAPIQQTAWDTRAAVQTTQEAIPIAAQNVVDAQSAYDTKLSERNAAWDAYTSTYRALDAGYNAVAIASNEYDSAQQNLNTLQSNLQNAQNDLQSAQDNLNIALQTADSLANIATTAVNEAVTAMENATQTTINYYAEQKRIAAEKAAADAKAATNKAAADAALAAQQAADAQARADQAAALAAQAEADRIAAEAAIAQAQAEKEAAAAEAKAAEDAKIAAEQQAKEAEAAAAKTEQDAKIQAEKDAQAKEDAAKADADAKAKAAQDAAVAEQKAKDEAVKAAQDAKNAQAEADKKAAEAQKLEAQKAIDDAKKATDSGKELTSEQKVAVVAALVQNLKPGESVSAADVKTSGVSFADLPPTTPVEMRTSENGEVLVITAEVAANVTLVQDPAALLNAAFTDPGAALAALGSIGADMTPGERKQATHMVVATVVATGAALNAVSLAAGGGAPAGGGSTGGSSGGTNSGGTRRRNETW